MLRNKYKRGGGEAFRPPPRLKTAFMRSSRDRTPRSSSPTPPAEQKSTTIDRQQTPRPADLPPPPQPSLVTRRFQNCSQPSKQPQPPRTRRLDTPVAATKTTATPTAATPTAATKNPPKTVKSVRFAASPLRQHQQQGVDNEVAEATRTLLASPMEDDRAVTDLMARGSREQCSLASDSIPIEHRARLQLPRPTTDNVAAMTPRQPNALATTRSDISKTTKSPAAAGAASSSSHWKTRELLRLPFVRGGNAMGEQRQDITATARSSTGHDPRQEAPTSVKASAIPSHHEPRTPLTDATAHTLQHRRSSRQDELVSRRSSCDSAVQTEFDIHSKHDFHDVTTQTSLIMDEDDEGTVELVFEGRFDATTTDRGGEPQVRIVDDLRNYVSTVSYDQQDDVEVINSNNTTDFYSLTDDGTEPTALSTQEDSDLLYPLTYDAAPTVPRHAGKKKRGLMRRMLAPTPVHATTNKTKNKVAQYTDRVGRSSSFTTPHPATPAPWYSQHHPSIPDRQAPTPQQHNPGPSSSHHRVPSMQSLRHVNGPSDLSSTNNHQGPTLTFDHRLEHVESELTEPEYFERYHDSCFVVQEPSGPGANTRITNLSKSGSSCSSLRRKNAATAVEAVAAAEAAAIEVTPAMNVPPLVNRRQHSHHNTRTYPQEEEYLRQPIGQQQHYPEKEQGSRSSSRQKYSKSSRRRTQPMSKIVEFQPHETDDMISTVTDPSALVQKQVVLEYVTSDLSSSVAPSFGQRVSSEAALSRAHIQQIPMPLSSPRSQSDSLSMHALQSPESASTQHVTTLFEKRSPEPSGSVDFTRAQAFHKSRSFNSHGTPKPSRVVDTNSRDNLGDRRRYIPSSSVGRHARPNFGFDHGKEDLLQTSPFQPPQQHQRQQQQQQHQQQTRPYPGSDQIRFEQFDEQLRNIGDLLDPSETSSSRCADSLVPIGTLTLNNGSENGTRQNEYIKPPSTVEEEAEDHAPAESPWSITALWPSPFFGG